MSPCSSLVEGRNVDEKAIKRYAKFHGRNPDKAKSINLVYPKVLIYLGSGVAIEYKSNKAARGVPKGKHIYRHKFGSGVKIYTDKQGRTLFVLGGKFRITDWMRG